MPDTHPGSTHQVPDCDVVVIGAGMSGLLPKGLLAAASAEAAATFDLSQIKHVVYVMQENRSFDHYFGTFPGVRGFDDPTATLIVISEDGPVMVMRNGEIVDTSPVNEKTTNELGKV